MLIKAIVRPALRTPGGRAACDAAQGAARTGDVNAHFLGSSTFPLAT